MVDFAEIAREFGIPVAVAIGSVGFVRVLLKFVKKIFEDNDAERKKNNEKYIEHLETNQKQLIELITANQEIIKDNLISNQKNQEITSKLADVIKNNSEIMLKFSNRLELFEFAIKPKN